jgi:hypothetical protein
MDNHDYFEYVDYLHARSNSLLNSQAYIGIFYTFNEVNKILDNLPESYVYVLWEKQDISDCAYALQPHLSFNTKHPRKVPRHIRLYLNMFSSRLTVKFQDNRSVFIGNGEREICPYALFSIIMYLETNNKTLQKFYNIPDSRHFCLIADSSKNMVIPYNKFQKKVWSLRRITSFMVDYLYVDNRNCLFTHLPKSVYKSILTQEYLNDCENLPITRLIEFII